MHNRFLAVGNLVVLSIIVVNNNNELMRKQYGLLLRDSDRFRSILQNFSQAREIKYNKKYNTLPEKYFANFSQNPKRIKYCTYFYFQCRRHIELISIFIHD